MLSACGSDGASGTPSGGGAASGSTASGGAAGVGHAGSGGTTSAGGALASAGANAAGADSTGNAGANAAGASCNTLVNSAPEIAETVMAGDAPAPVGGMITDGTYYETAYLVYDPPSSSPTNILHQATITIEGSRYQAVSRDETGAEVRATIELTPSGSALDMQQTCRTNARYMMNQLNVLGYDATPTTFTIHNLLDRPEGDVVQVFTKQN